MSGLAAERRYSTRRAQALVFALAWVIGELVGATGLAIPPSRSFSQLLQVPAQFEATAFAASFLIYLGARPSLRSTSLTLVAAAAAEVGLGLLRHQVSGLPFSRAFGAPGHGLGLASILALALALRRAAEQERVEAKTRLLTAVLLPGFVVLSGFFLTMTAALHPLVLDPSMLALDWGFGAQPSWLLGRAFAVVTPLRQVCGVVYGLLPLFLAAVYMAKDRAGKREHGDVFGAFLLIGLVGSVLYHAVPVIGPRFAYPEWPRVAPALASIRELAMRGPVAPRNCMPSLHTAWALTGFLGTRGLSPRARAAALVFLVLTLLATLGLGFHYLVDLVVAVPFTFALEALLSPPDEAARRERRWLLGVCVALVAGWLVVAQSDLPRLIGPVPGLVPILSLLTVGGATMLRRRHRRTSDAAEPDLVVASLEVLPSRARTRVATMFVMSGVAGLVYEVVFCKRLALTFGSTAASSATVLTTFLGGLALGAWLGGRFGPKTRKPLRFYAFCELGVAALCLLSPWSFQLVQRLYLALAAGPVTEGHRGLQVALGALVLLPPTVLMGMTTPVLARTLEAEGEGFGRNVALLYVANTAGAAVGALTTGYFLLPVLGVTASTIVAVLLNLGAAALAYRLGRAQDLSPAEASDDVTASEPPMVGRLALATLTIGGAVTIALEVTYTHLLAVIAGNSAYAFSLMLCAFLLALGTGAAVARFILARVRAVEAMGVSQALVALSILLGTFQWDAMPAYFGSFQGSGFATTFAAREVVRGLVCCMVLMPPGIAIGASYPFAMEALVLATTGSRVRAFGGASAWNTFGNVTGSIVATFVLIPRLGSLRTLELLACVSLALSLATQLSPGRERRTAAAVWLSPIVLGALLLQPSSYDWGSIATGSNVYFTASPSLRIVDHAESIDGGLTTVALSVAEDGRPVRTLFTNGKFQGDDHPAREVRAQLAFGLIPALHTGARDRAAVIGFGTGMSARVVHDLGYRDVDVVDLSADILALADRHFGAVNGAVLHRAGVHASVTDGRNHLALTNARYDLITMELTSIWFAGAASLYSRDFYALARARLSTRGVLQQWLQLHHLYRDDIAVVLATIRAEFKHVYLYYVGTQGMLIGCDWECPVTPENAAQIDATKAVARDLEAFGGRSENLLAHRLLTPPAVDGILRTLTAQTGGEPLLSTDDNLWLEYSTPKGNVRDYGESLRENVRWLRSLTGR